MLQPLSYHFDGLNIHNLLYHDNHLYDHFDVFDDPDPASGSLMIISWFAMIMTLMIILRFAMIMTLMINKKIALVMTLMTTCRFAMIYHLAKDAALKRANTIPGNLGLAKPLPVRYPHHRHHHHHHHHHSQKHNHHHHHHRRCHHHNDHLTAQPTVSASGENNG